MDDTPLGRFFGVVARSRTWLNLLFQIIAFPLGLFYFIFLVIGLSVGLGLVIIWVGIPILLVVAGAWWLFGAFERLQARALLGADVPDAPRSWETVPGVWGKVKAHFGNGATWKDLLYLLAKLAFGVVSFTLVVTLASIIGWLFALPFVSHWHVAAFDYGNGQEWIPPLWLGLLGIPAAILMIFASLHVLNAWGWVCKRWAEVMFRVAPAAPVSVAPPAPLVSTSPQPPALLVAQPAAAPAPPEVQPVAVAPAPPVTQPTAAAPAPEAPPAAAPGTPPAAAPVAGGIAAPDAPSAAPQTAGPGADSPATEPPAAPAGPQGPQQGTD
jgi:hypothetical protein